MSWNKAAALLAPIARALHYAHGKNIIHRDIKPSNILINEHGDPMLSDFGVAKMLMTEETMDLTGTSVGIGTPYYMSPEQGRNKDVGPKSDIYSLGVVLYEMVTGIKPFEADTPLAVMMKHVKDPLPRPSEKVKGLHRSAENAILLALAKDPENRYKNMQEMALVLEGQESRYIFTSPLKRTALTLGIISLVTALVFIGYRYLPENIEGQLVDLPSMTIAQSPVVATRIARDTAIPGTYTVRHEGDYQGNLCIERKWKLGY